MCRTRSKCCPTAAEHPITAGISDFQLVTEQYWVLCDSYIDVLATTTQPVRPWDPWTRPVTSPAIWTRQWGHGRIFVTTAGHRVEILQDANVRTIIERGTAMGEPLRIGIVGLGTISKQYLDTLDRLESVVVTAVADIDEQLARTVAGNLIDVHACSVPELVESSRRRPGAESDHPGRTSRRCTAGHQGRQERLR